MPLVSELDLPAFDMDEPELRGDRFHDAMRELREQNWIAAANIGYVVLDREASDFFLRTKSAIFPGRLIGELGGVNDGPLHEQIERNIINVNGDDHRRLRNLVNPALAPRAVERYRPLMRTYLEELLDAVADDGRCEFVAAIAKPYPSQVIAAVMGAPRADAERLHRWSNIIQRQFDLRSLTEERQLLDDAVAEFYEWANALLERRRTDPGDDLISTLLAAEEAGDRLSDVECVNLVLNVLVGGVDTTQSQLAQAIRLFAAHPDQWEALAADPQLAPAAVEEVVRFEPITPFTARMLVEDVTFRDVLFPANTVISVASVVANREPGDPDELERFDITADRGEARPLTFGAGIHYCVGANLARAELQEALTCLPARLTRIELDGEPVLDTISGIYGVLELPVRFVARSS
jgi:cytochrome P450